MKNFAYVFLISLFVVTACKKDDEPIQVPDLKFSNGVFIINEGGFLDGTGTISFYSKSTKAVEYDLFQTVNGVPLGNVVQSLTYYNGRIYIVVNNSNKIEVVSSTDFKSVGTIDGLVSPRYFMPVSDSKAYVTGWDDKVSIINLTTLGKTGNIDAGTGPEKMLLQNGMLFVLNQGGFTIDSTITVVNTTTDEVVKTIQVYHKPSGIVSQADGKIWVMCSGKGWNGFPATGGTPGHLVSIDPVSLEIIDDFVFPVIESHPEKLVIDRANNTMYFNYPGGTCRYIIGEGNLNLIPYISHGAMFYALGFDATSSIIYTSDPLDFSQDGWVYRFRASDGVKIDSIRAGIIPGEFWFME